MSEPEWTPYVPPWYPDRGEYHNPFATDPSTIQQGSESFYSAWVRTLAPGELERRIREYHERRRGGATA